MEILYREAHNSNNSHIAKYNLEQIKSLEWVATIPYGLAQETESEE